MNLSELFSRIKLAWRIVRSCDCNLVKHAKRELRSSLNEEVDSMNRMMADHLIDMVRVFSAAGHSGFSAAYAQGAIKLLLNYEPLGPLTGDRDEWVHVFDDDGDKVYQNVRCSHVFRRIGKEVNEYDSEGVIFREPNGVCFQSAMSRVPVTFPYTPKRVYADVPFDATEEQKAEAARLALVAAAA